MISKDQVLKRIEELTAYCEANGYEGGGYASFISVLTPAITQYFESNSAELEESVKDLVGCLYSDIILRDTVWEIPMGKPLPTDFPQGYDDLTAIFDGDGVFTKILNISPAAFLAGFPVETTTDEATGTSSTVVLTNPIIAEWQSKVNNAHNAEIAKIDNIISFCFRGGSEQDSISMFEDRGKCTRTKGKQDIAVEIFINKKVKEVIETFNLDVYIPTYL